MPTPEELYGKPTKISPEELYGTPQDVPLPEEVTQYLPEQEKEKDTWEEFKKDVPAMVGGIVGPLVTSKLGPAAQVFAAGIGGMLGEAAQETHEIMRGEDTTPREFATEVGMAGVEQAAFEKIGQIALKLGGRAWAKLHPQKTKAAQSVEDIFKGYGGEFTLPQQTDSWVIQQLEGLSKGSLTGSGVFKAVDATNDAAFKSMQDDLSKLIAKRASTHLSDEDIGNLVLHTLKGGRAAHSNIAGDMYSAFDEMVAPKTAIKEVLEKVTKDTTGKSGKFVTRDVLRTVEETVGGVPVDITPIKRYAFSELESLKELNNIGAGDVGKQLLDQLAGLQDDLFFSSAHELRSNLLSMSRDLKDVVGAGKARHVINNIVEIANKTMDASASKAGPQVYKQYRAIDKFYRMGKEAFDNDFIAKMIIQNKHEPARIGEVVFKDGNVADIKSMKRGLAYAAKLDPTLNKSKVWHSLQSGYVESLISKSMTPDGTIRPDTLMKVFTDRKKARTLQHAFTMEQRSAIRNFAQVGQIINKKPEGGLGMVMQLAQGSAIVGIATGHVDAPEAAAIFLGPRVLAKALTSPKVARLMTTAMKTKGMTAQGAKITSKLISEVTKLQIEDQKEQEALDEQR